MSSPAITTRKLIYQNLLSFEQNKTRIDQLFNQTFRKYTLSDQEKRLMRNVVSGVIRNLTYLDWLAAGLYNGHYKKLLKKTKSILRPALFEFLFLDQIPAHATVNEYVKLAGKTVGVRQRNLINAMLRNHLRQADTPDPGKMIKDPIERISVQYSFPQWMIKHWVSLWGELETEELCRHLNIPPDFDLRVNTAKTSRSDLLDELNKAGIQAEASLTMKKYIKIYGMQAFLSADWIKNGLCSVQDESAGIPIELLGVKKNDWFLDICSAPGGKFTQVLEKDMGTGRAVAMDLDLNRLKRVRENSAKYPRQNPFFVVADGRATPFKIKFDKILLDAPCSGLGVIRKHPDIKWRRELKDIAKFSELQYGLLESASQQLKENGRLVYSTCTIDSQENENIINRFLQRYSIFQLDKPPAEVESFVKDNMIFSFPHLHNMDGSFSVALIHKPVKS